MRHAIELCLQKDVKKRIADIHDVKLLLEGTFESRSRRRAAKVAEPLWRRALPISAALLGAAILASAYVWRATPATTPPAAPLAVTRFVVTPPATAPLTNLGGYDVVISPDGERLAYYAQDPQTGGVALHVRELDGLEARRLPGTEVAQPPAGGNLNPFFSADGRSIGFRSPDRGIIRVAIDGAPPLEIIDDEPVFLGAAWTTDDTLIYSTGARLQRVSAGGGCSPEPLTPENEGGSVAAPASTWRACRALRHAGGPNGARGRARSGDGRAEDSDRRRGEPDVFSTGHIVFVRGSTLMAARFNLAELTLTGEPVALLQGVRHPSATMAADYALSATGTLVYVPGREENVTGAAVVWVDRNGRAVERALNELVANPRNPKLSPDGGRLVLTTGQIADADVWTYDLGGRPPIPLAVVGNNRNAVWSPDGAEVAFAAGPGGAPPTSISRGPTAVCSIRSPCVPKGSLAYPNSGQTLGEIFYLLRSADPNIVATPAAPAGEVRDIVVTDDAEFDPALSPDGRWLAYASNRTGQPEIWVKGYPDGVPVRVSRSGGSSLYGRSTAVSSFIAGHPMMAVAVETEGAFSFGAPTRLFSEPYFILPIQVPVPTTSRATAVF